MRLDRRFSAVDLVHDPGRASSAATGAPRNGAAQAGLDRSTTTAPTTPSSGAKSGTLIRAARAAQLDPLGRVHDARGRG